MATGAVFGQWTHRRCDIGGNRFLLADVGRSRPEIAWSWRPSHAGSVDQVRIGGEYAHVATLPQPDRDAPEWDHATVFALELTTGRVVAQRVLADPVPVAAMAIDQGVVHVMATRKGEPIFSYGLGVGDLRPRRRQRVVLDRDAAREDILDAWALTDGTLWSKSSGPRGGRGFTRALPRACP